MFRQASPRLIRLFKESRQFSALSQRDRAFVRMLVTTVVRRLGQIDDLIRHALSKFLTSPFNPPILEYILLGCGAAVLQNIPDHAAINTSVLLAGGRRTQACLKGFVNAIFTADCRRRVKNGSRQDVPRLNTPEWLLENLDSGLWVADCFGNYYGQFEWSTVGCDVKQPEQTAPVGRRLWWWFCRRAAFVCIMRVWFRIWFLKTGCGGFRMLRRLYQQKFVLGTNIEGQVVLIWRAAPGGKTAQLASQGGQVIAVDRSAKRIQRLQDNMKRMRLGHSVRGNCLDGCLEIAWSDSVYFIGCSLFGNGYNSQESWCFMDEEWSWSFEFNWTSNAIAE